MHSFFQAAKLIVLAWGTNQVVPQCEKEEGRKEGKKGSNEGRKEGRKEGGKERCLD